MKLERQFQYSSVQAKSAGMKQLEEYRENCPKLCEKVHRCVPLFGISYTECENGCRYHYVKNLQSVATNIRGASSPQAAQCKREVIMKVQAKTMSVLNKYGYSIDDF